MCVRTRRIKPITAVYTSMCSGYRWEDRCDRTNPRRKQVTTAVPEPGIKNAIDRLSTTPSFLSFPATHYIQHYIHTHTRERAHRNIPKNLGILAPRGQKQQQQLQSVRGQGRHRTQVILNGKTKKSVRQKQKMTSRVNHTMIRGTGRGGGYEHDVLQEMGGEEGGRRHER